MGGTSPDSTSDIQTVGFEGLWKLVNENGEPEDFETLRAAEAERDRLRELNRKLTDDYNALLISASRERAERDRLRAALGSVERELRERGDGRISRATERDVREALDPTPEYVEHDSKPRAERPDDFTWRDPTEAPERRKLNPYALEGGTTP